MGGEGSEAEREVKWVGGSFWNWACDVMGLIMWDSWVTQGRASRVYVYMDLTGYYKMKCGCVGGDDDEDSDEDGWMDGWMDG